MAAEKKQDGYSDFNENASSVWEFESEEQKKEMLEPITQTNCGKKLKLVRDLSGLSRRELASVIGISKSTVFRIETKKTLPTKDFMLRLGGLVAIGHARYRSTLKMSTYLILTSYSQAPTISARR